MRITRPSANWWNVVGLRSPWTGGAPAPPPGVFCA